MTRVPGESAWRDHLVRRFRRTDQISRMVRKQLDDVLTDWTFSEWRRDRCGAPGAGIGSGLGRDAHPGT